MPQLERSASTPINSSPTKPDWTLLAKDAIRNRKPMTPEQEAAYRREKEEIEAVARAASLSNTKQQGWQSVVGPTQAGKRYASCTLDNFVVDQPQRQTPAIAQIRGFMADVVEHTEACRGLVLYGPCGTGKDHLAVACLRQAYWDANLSVRFVYGRDFVILARDRIHQGKESEMEWLATYTKPDILCISDPLPPDGELNANQVALFATLIHHRYRDMKPTWLTLNAEEWNIQTEAGLKTASRLSVPVFDRLSDCTTLVRCQWASRRQPRKARNEEHHRN